MMKSKAVLINTARCVALYCIFDMYIIIIIITTAARS